MKITKDSVARFHYKLTNADGEVLDSSEGKDPLAYLHGHGNIIPGLEEALDGHGGGDQFAVTIAPEDAYGIYDQELVQTLPRSAFQGVDEIEVGMQFQAEAEGGVSLVTVTGVAEESVTIDGNHPLAGVELHFDITVVDVRDATPEELEHGHTH